MPSVLKLTSRTGYRWQPWFYSGLVAHCYIGLSEGAYSNTETRCTVHAEPTYVFETHSRTQMSQNRTSTTKRDPRERTQSARRTLKLFAISDSWRQTRLL